MNSPKLRRDLRTSLREVCEAMRCQKEAVDRTSSDFKNCSRESRKTIENSYRILDRLSRDGDGQWHQPDTRRSTPSWPAVRAKP